MTAFSVGPARVYRFYRGGALLGRLRGKDEPDGSFPEDWLGSITGATNPGHEKPNEGLSVLDDGRLLRDAVADDPVFWLGEPHLRRYGATTGLLVKLLDAAERLPVHAHPSRSYAQQHLGSQFGKTEAWIVLDTRSEDARVWVGQRENTDPEEYRRWIDEQDTDSLLGSLNEVPVGAGDVVFVPAGVPHAIGPGVLIAELQEPTDFLVLCEWRGFPIEPEDAHLGLGWDRAFDALDVGAHTPVRELPEDAKEFFWADEVLEPAGRFAVLLVLEGVGTIDGTAARPGDAFVVPAAASELQAEGELRVLRCLAPRP